MSAASGTAATSATWLLLPAVAASAAAAAAAAAAVATATAGLLAGLEGEAVFAGGWPASSAAAAQTYHFRVALTCRLSIAVVMVCVSAGPGLLHDCFAQLQTGTGYSSLQLATYMS
jgi:hypothetical protein